MRNSLKVLIAALPLVVGALGAGTPGLALSQSGQKDLFRLVVVVDPQQIGQTVSQFLSEADASARGSNNRAALGNPKSMRLLLANRRNENAISALVRDTPDFRLNNTVVLEYDDEATMYRAIMTVSFCANEYRALGRYASIANAQLIWASRAQSMPAPPRG